MTRGEASNQINDIKTELAAHLLKKDIEALDMAISALSGNKGGWIPIKEKEPEESMDVYITVELFDRPPFVEKAFFFKTQRKYFAHGITVDSSLITAWQPYRPLPEPYKKGE